MIVDFCVEEPGSIKSFAIKKMTKLGLQQYSHLKTVNVCKAFTDEFHLQNVRSILFSR